MPKQKNMQPLMIRNDKLFDGWSIVHVITSILFTLTFGPKIALIVVFLWEPLEIYLLSPLLAKIDVRFGDETLKNSLSDLVFDAVGVGVGYLLLRYTFIEQLIVF